MAEDRMIVEDVVEDGRHLSVEEEALLLRKCRLNKVDLIEKMIDSGKIGPNFVFSNGETILIIACKRGYKKLVFAVVQRGANMDIRDQDGNAAVHWANAMGFNDLTKYLISKGANDRLLNKKGYTCHNWQGPDLAERERPLLDSNTPSSTAFPDRGSTEGSSVYLPALSPQKEHKGGSSMAVSQMYKKDPRPPGRARKKVRTRDAEHSIYQQMYLGLQEPERSHSTPPVRQHEHNDSTRRPSSSRGRIDSASADKTGQGLEKNESQSPKTTTPNLKGPTVSTEAPEHEDAPGLTSIFSFLKNGGVINEPLTIEAMRKLGLVPEQLKPVDKAELKRKYHEDKIVELRYKHLEERRQELIKRCIEERRRLKARSRDASLEEIFIEYAGDMQMNIAEFMEMLSKLGLLSEGRDRPGMLGKTHATNIFKAFAIRIGKTFEITWEQFVKMEKQISSDLGIKSIRCPDEKVKSKPITTPGRGPDAVANKHALSTEDRIEEIRKKDEKKHEMEMRRVEKTFARVLETRAQTQAYKEQTRRLETERLQRLEAKTFEHASLRIDTEFKHVERLMLQEQAYRRQVKEEQDRMLKKQEEVKAALERREAERRDRNVLVKETLKIKEQLRAEQRRQNDRKEEYNRKILRDKIARDNERLDAEQKEREALLRERRQLWTQKAMEREVFERAAVNFKKTGILKKPPGIKSMGSFDDFIEKELVKDMTDSNPQAALLSKDSVIKGVVDNGEYVYFKVCVDDATQVLFSIKSLMGRAEMYIGNHQTPFPTQHNHTWSKVGHDKLTVFHLDRHFNLGYYYIGVYGQGLGQSMFSLSPAWSITSTGSEKFDDNKVEEAKVLDRVKERINKVLQSRLAGKDADFVRKYEELFMEKQTASLAKKD